MGSRFDGLMLLCDMDGVLYRGHEPIAGAAAAIDALQAAGAVVGFATNNGWTPIPQLVERLRRMGMVVDDDQIVGASWMAAELMRRTYPEARRPFVIGGSELRRQLRRVGLRPVPPNRPDDADSLALGLDPAFSYLRLARAQSVARRGVPLLATDLDAAYPWQTGWLPGTGAIVRAVETASGRTAVAAGKPDPAMYTELVRRHGALRRTVVVVGDNLDTDIAAGKRLGVPTILVLTGISTEAEAAARPPEQRPDAVIATVADLPDFLTHHPFP